jgi:hypothetical protein
LLPALSVVTLLQRTAQQKHRTAHDVVTQIAHTIYFVPLPAQNCNDPLQKVGVACEAHCCRNTPLMPDFMIMPRTHGCCFTPANVSRVCQEARRSVEAKESRVHRPHSARGLPSLLPTSHPASSCLPSSHPASTHRHWEAKANWQVLFGTSSVAQALGQRFKRPYFPERPRSFPIIGRSTGPQTRRCLERPGSFHPRSGQSLW